MRIAAITRRGRYGELYEAYDSVRDRAVALKPLDIELAKSATYVERFRRESRTAARLQEPHVMPVHDWGEVDGVLYIDMRLVNGCDLREHLAGRGPLEPRRAVEVVEQVAAALDAAHQIGLVHRDVKPANILLTGELFAYLVDFGIAHRIRRPIDEYGQRHRIIRIYGARAFRAQYGGRAERGCVRAGVRAL